MLSYVDQVAFRTRLLFRISIRKYVWRGVPNKTSHLPKGMALRYYQQECIICLCTAFIEAWLASASEIIRIAKVPEVPHDLFWGNLRSCYPWLSAPVTPIRAWNWNAEHGEGSVFTPLCLQLTARLLPRGWWLQMMCWAVTSLAPIPSFCGHLLSEEGN